MIPTRGKVILVTGASSGFGKLAVSLLLERGHQVIAGIRGGQERLESVFGPKIFHQGRLSAVDLHMERSETFDLAVEKIRKDFGGRLDALVNNAGYGLLGPIEAQSPEQIRMQMEVNFFGPVFLIQKLIPLLKQSRGRIINISSIAGLSSFPNYGSYNASKFALEGITESLHYELKPFGIQVGLIEPGGFKTEFMTRSLIYAEGAKDPKSPYYAGFQRFEQRIQQKNRAFSGDPMRVARLIARMCEGRSMAIRNVIGKDAWLIYLARKILPERFRVWLQGHVFRILF